MLQSTTFGPSLSGEGNGSLLEIQSTKNKTNKSLQLPSYQMYNGKNRHPCSSKLASSMDSLEDVDEKHIQGFIFFSLFYDRLQSRLEVTILETKGLVAQASSQCVNNFVHVRVLCVAMEDKEQQFTCVLKEYQTGPVKDGCSSIFGETFSCTVTKEEMPRVIVRLAVRDCDKHFLGEVCASLNDLNLSYPLEMLSELQKPQKVVVGKALLSLKYMPTSHRLEVGVLKIRMVFRSSKLEKALNAKTKILYNQCKIQHQKTSERIRCDMTIFNEFLIFTLPKITFRECILTLSVYELGLLNRSKKFVGQISFGKSPSMEDVHWRLMMHAVRQPVTLWHLLYL